MPYTIRLSDGTLLTTIADRAIDTKTLPLALIGRGAMNYGTDVADNFVYLLENFKSTTPPKNPLVGQLWFDSGLNILRYYVGGTGDLAHQWLEITHGTPSPYNLPNTVVVRDGQGNFSANTVTANLQGIADSAKRWTTPRTMTLSNDVTGSVTFDGSANIALPVTVNHSATADRWTTARTLTLAGAVTGAATVDGSGNVTLNTAYPPGVANVTVSHALAADYATNAGHANNADYALNANHATYADVATNANHATNADHAQLADNSVHANNADNAYLASYASQFQYARLITLSGDVSGAQYFDASGNITIQTSIGGGSPQQQQAIAQTQLAATKAPFNFYRATNNIRSVIYTNYAGYVTCMGPIYYTKQRADTYVMCLMELSSFNPTYGGAGAVSLLMLDANSGLTDIKGLSSSFQTQNGAIGITDTGVFQMRGGGAGQHAYYLQCSRGDNITYQTIFNPDNADFNGGSHGPYGSTSTFMFFEIFP